MYVKKAAPQISHLGTGQDAMQSVQRSINDLRQYLEGEFNAIEIAIRWPEVIGIQFQVNYHLPQRFKEGDLYYFADGVAGGQAGLYIRDGNSWRKL